MTITKNDCFLPDEERGEKIMNIENMIIYAGDSLQNHVVSVLEGISKERDIAKELHNYMESPNDRKICCLYGLRRTGKTILMLQEAKRIGDYEKSLLIECGDGTSVNQVRKAIDTYPDVKYIFIDEVTKTVNFLGAASVFANLYAAEGKKVVLAGTDSLGFYLAENDELFDRAHFLHTTYISYKEHHSILGKEIMDYIRYGGTLSPENVFYNRDTSNYYSNSAIVFNIVRTLEKWNQGRNFGTLWDLLDSGDLPTFINKVIEYNNRLFLSKIINKDFTSHDLGSLIDLMTKSGIADPDKIYPQGEAGKKIREKLQERLRIALHIKDSTLLADEKNVNIIIQYLKALDVLYELPNFNGQDSKYKEYIFTQTGMRYSQASDLIQALMTSETFLENYTIQERNAITQKLEQDICGGILEDIVLYQTIQSLKNEQNTFLVSKYREELTGKEFDVFVANLAQNKSCIIEVKLSKEKDAHQVRHLTDSDFCQKFEKLTGTKINSKIVLYNGKTCFDPYKEKLLSNKVIYLNVSDYLIHAEKLCKAFTTFLITDKNKFCKIVKNVGIKIPNQNRGLGNAD